MSFSFKNDQNFTADAVVDMCFPASTVAALGPRRVEVNRTQIHPECVEGLLCPHSLDAAAMQRAHTR